MFLPVVQPISVQQSVLLRPYSVLDNLPFSCLYAHDGLSNRIQSIELPLINVLPSYSPQFSYHLLLDLLMADSISHQTLTRSGDQDIEASCRSNNPCPDGTKDTSKVDESTSSPDTEENELTYSNAPKLSQLRLFWYFFYNFGLFAWGGPVAQIALIKEQIVVKEKWITLTRFQRVFAVYQILPGPEAAERCMFFGCLSAGRIGGIIAGLAFILPGFILMLVASYLYTLAGLENQYFNASFRTLQPIVAAMVRQIQESFDIV